MSKQNIWAKQVPGSGAAKTSSSTEGPMSSSEAGKPCHFRTSAWTRLSLPERTPFSPIEGRFLKGHIQSPGDQLAYYELYTYDKSICVHIYIYVYQEVYQLRAGFLRGCMRPARRQIRVKHQDPEVNRLCVRPRGPQPRTGFCGIWKLDTRLACSRNADAALGGWRPVQSCMAWDRRTTKSKNIFHILM